ncbi:piggyBac transposable element-derived protein 4-like [Vespula maculifrons]|uniref:PiggyBac transposable element-derived protein 4-like n=1 Tax=Vespula maculifrons TaxID=7453 RepID=A0ABD2CN39_VESMC
MSFCKDISGKDNWYTNVDLAKKLIPIHTRLVVILWKKLTKKSARSSISKIKTWRCYALKKGDVLLFFTKHSAKWLLKLAVELLLNTCIVNAMLLFEQIIRRNIEIPDFRMKIVSYSTKCREGKIEDYISPRENLLRKSTHEMKKCPKIMITSPQKISSQRLIFLYEFKLGNNAAITTHTINQAISGQDTLFVNNDDLKSLMEVNPSVTIKQPSVRMKDTISLLEESKNE